MINSDKKDILVFIVLIPIINAINYYITYNNITFNSYFVFTFIIDTLQGYSAWLLIRFIILKLEKAEPLINFSFKRLLKQLFLTSGVGLLMIIVLTETINAIAKETPVPSNFYTHDIFIYLIWILVINGIYIGIYYYSIFKSSEAKLTSERNLRTTGVPVKIGDKTIKIPLNHISGFYVEGGFTYVIDQVCKTSIIDGSLDKLEKTLPEELFFRVNRKYLLKRHVITSFKRIADGKLLLTVSLKEPFPQDMNMSRLKAPAFKTWFAKDVVS